RFSSPAPSRSTVRPGSSTSWSPRWILRSAPLSSRQIHSKSRGMGKKQVRQMRTQMRKVQPKQPAASNAQGATRKQRERYVQSGGMLQGYAPDYVIRIGYISIGVAVACLLIIAALLFFIPAIYGWLVAVAAAIAWIFPIALLASFVGPGFRLALKDRK